MFGLAVLTTAFIGCAICAPQGGPPKGSVDEILSQTNEIEPAGGYKWSFETSNGIKAEETGTLQKSGTPSKDPAESGDAIAVQGSYSYKDKEGNDISVVYTSDAEKGFVPQGAHLPTPPPIPPQIQKALDWIASQPSTTERASSGKRK